MRCIISELRADITLLEAAGEDAALFEELEDLKETAEQPDAPSIAAADDLPNGEEEPA